MNELDLAPPLIPIPAAYMEIIFSPGCTDADVSAALDIILYT
jgi:hypothetical protein